MQLKVFPIRALALVSALVLASSCNGRDADVQLNLQAPPEIVASQAGDVRPEITEQAAVSEQAYEDFISNRLDWGDRRNLLAYRWCLAWNTVATALHQVDCGVEPAGVRSE